MVDTLSLSRPGIPVLESAAPPDRDLLRQQLRNQRKSVLSEERSAAAQAVAAQALPLLSESAIVAGYLAIQGELSLDSLLLECRRQNMQTCVPLLRGSRLAFSAFDDQTPMSTNRYGITEPLDQRTTLRPDQLDSVLVPLVAFDLSGNRLGMGGGFYDRSFEFRLKSDVRKPLLIGVAYDFQQVDSLPAESWDVPLDVIITPSQIIDRR